jgi:hypothetical protein
LSGQGADQLQGFISVYHAEPLPLANCASYPAYLN